MRLVAEPVLPPIPERLPVPPPLPEGATMADMLREDPVHPQRGAWFADWEWRLAYNKSVDEMEERITRCSQDILEFGKEYFPEVFALPYADFHRELMDLIFDLDPEEWYYPDQHGNELEKQGIVVAAPRGHAKSSCVTFLLPIYCAVFRIKRFIVIFSNNRDGVTLFCTQIKREIEENEKLRADFGNLSGRIYGRPWGAFNFVIAHPDEEGGRTPAFETMIAGRSVGTNVRGMRFGAYRPDLIVGDDMEKDENVQTAEQRNKMQGLLTQRIMPMLDPEKGLLLICGTIFHYDSLLSRLLRPDSARGWVQRIWKCILPPARDVLDEDAIPLWPERWPINTLRSKRLTPPMTLHEWNCEWMNDPSDPESREYKAEWFRWYTRSENLRYNSKEKVYEWHKPGERNTLTGEPNWQKLFVYQAVDPSPGLNKNDDYFAMITGGISALSHDVVIIDLVRGHFPFAEQVNLIESRFMAFPMTIGCAIEAENYQDVLRQTIVNRQARRYGVRKIPVKGIKQRRQRDSKMGRLRRRAWDMQTGTVWFPAVPEGDQRYSDAPYSEPTPTNERVRVHPAIYPLYLEMIQFPKSKNDDTLDAFDMLLTVMGKRHIFSDEAEAKRQEFAKEDNPLVRPKVRRALEPVITPHGGAGVTRVQKRNNRRRTGRGAATLA